ncbi:hypothetical protein KCP71_06965 [Salmonella enterica subsp. enterica]|nr:hypothetical protein KCP71_06965 [Salmonella enterica subsp. enterica]
MTPRNRFRGVKMNASRKNRCNRSTLRAFQRHRREHYAKFRDCLVQRSGELGKSPRPKT